MAGDRSLVSTVAHELAHSWSGNLVTNATWRDQWLNEGMTSYLESRLMAVIYGKDRVDEERVLSYQELLLDLATVPRPMQALAPRLDSGDPDDFQGTIHYSKGQLFLQYLENAFGRAAFDRFLFTYFKDFAFQTITTERFLDYLDENLLSAEPGKVQSFGCGRMAVSAGTAGRRTVAAVSDSRCGGRACAGLGAGEVNTADIPITTWSPQATVHFINSLPAELSDERLQQLDQGLGLSTTKNAEIGRTWFIQVAMRRHVRAYGRARAIPESLRSRPTGRSRFTRRWPATAPTSSLPEKCSHVRALPTIRS